jgi:hypothetical protein
LRESYDGSVAAVPIVTIAAPTPIRPPSPTAKQGLISQEEISQEAISRKAIVEATIVEVTMTMHGHSAV